MTARRRELAFASRIRPGRTADNVATVAHRWRLQYGETPHNPKHAEIQRKLDALDPPTAEAIEAIIGNESWTREWCDVCNTRVERWVELGDQPDYDSTTLTICPRCIAAIQVAMAE